MLTLEEAAKAVKNDKSTLDLEKRLDQLIENLQKRISQNRKHLDNLKTSQESVEKECSALVNKAMKILTMLETTFRDELQNVFKRKSSSLDCEWLRLSNLLSILMHQKQILTASMAEGSNEECLVEREKILSRENEIRNNSEKVKTDSSLETMDFTFSPELKNLTTQINTLGSFSTKNQKSYRMQNAHINLLKRAKLCVCCAIFHQENFLITAYAEKQVLLVDGSLNCTSSIMVKGSPRDITVDGLGRVFVSLPDDREVLEVDIVTKTARKLFSSTIACWGLHWCDEAFYIASDNAIKMYSQDGIKQNTTQTSGTWMMCKTSKGEHLYQSNDFIIKNSLQNEEKKLFSRSGAKLRGVETDNEGNIYTVGMANGTLYQLTSDGTLLQEVNLKVLDLKSLLEICLSNKNNIVITTCFGDVALFEVS